MIKRKGLKAGVVLEIILILAGAGLIAKGAMTGLATYRIINNADIQKAEGTITAIGNYGFRANVQFSLPGSSETIGFSQDGFFVKNQIGDHVMTIYNPNNPANTRVERMDALWGMSALLGF